MNRIDFMNRLTDLLSDISESERDEAIAYYNDYLNDAGVENEQEVLDALGTPEELAATIKDGLLGDSENFGEFSEKGYQSKAADPENEIVPHKGEDKNDGGSNFGSSYGSAAADGQKKGQREKSSAHTAQSDLSRRYRGDETKKRKVPVWATILLVIFGLLASPVLLPILIVAAVIIVALTIVALLVAGILLFSGIICIVSGIISLFKGAAVLIATPAAATVTIGMSLFTIGVGILLTMAIGWVLMKLFPAAFRKAVDFCSRFFHKKGGNQE